MTTAILFCLLFLFMLIGMPVAVALGLSSLLTILFFGRDSLASLSLKLFETSEHFTLLAIPFFILSGAFMTTGGVARRMIRFAIACVGHLRGGLAIASVLACMLFAAVSGFRPQCQNFKERSDNRLSTIGANKLGERFLGLIILQTALYAPLCPPSKQLFRYELRRSPKPLA